MVELLRRISRRSIPAALFPPVVPRERRDLLWLHRTSRLSAAGVACQRFAVRRCSAALGWRVQPGRGVSLQPRAPKSARALAHYKTQELPGSRSPRGRFSLDLVVHHALWIRNCGKAQRVCQTSRPTGGFRQPHAQAEIQRQGYSQGGPRLSDRLSGFVRALRGNPAAVKKAVDDSNWMDLSYHRIPNGVHVH